jgi:hypothetical protein
VGRVGSKGFEGVGLDRQGWAHERGRSKEDGCIEFDKR